MKNNVYIKNTFILCTGIIISKLLGLLYVFPFSQMVGKEGVALFSYAYIPYNLFVNLATLGIPSAISKIVSKYETKGEFETVDKVFKLSMYIMALIGIVGCLILYSVSDIYASYILGGNDLYNSIDEVSSVVKIISTALIIIPLMSVIRGFFQGKENVIPTAISQVLEQFIRVLIILISSYLVINVYNKGVATAIKISVFAATIGGLVGLVVLIIFLKKRTFKRSENSISTKDLIKEIFITGLPFLIFGFSFSVYQFIDSLTVNRGLLAFGVSNPEYVFGIYSFEVQKLIFLPISMITALGIVVLPKIVKSYHQKKVLELKKTYIYNILLVSMYSIIIMSIYNFFSEYIYNFLYTKSNVGVEVFKNSSLIIIFISLNSIVQIFMQGLDLGKCLCINLFFGIIVKIVLNILLISNIGINGAIFATAIGFFVTVSLNIIITYRKLITMSKSN